MKKLKNLFKEHDLVKIVSCMLILIVVLSWIIPNGSYGMGAEFTLGKVERIGLTHIIYGVSYAIQNFSIQIVFLAFVGIFYGVISKTDGYKKLVNNIAEAGKGKEIRIAVILSLLVAVLSSILTNTFALFVFVPFLIHIFRKMGFDKLSTFVTVFGSMLVGVMGATYGSDGASALLTYLAYGGSEATITTHLLLRFGILLLAFIVFSFFNVKYLKNNFGKKNDEVKENDKYLLGSVQNKKAKVWPFIVVMALMFVLLVLGFVDWNGNFEIEIFDKFHEWFTGLAIGEFKIFDAIMGGSLSNMGYQLTTAFGKWYLFSYSVILAIMTVVVALISRMSTSDFFTNVGEGFKAILRPMILLILAYTSFVFVYWSSFIPTMVNVFGTNFNPFILSLQAALASLFNSDLGYLGFSLSYYIGSFVGKEGNLVFLIFLTIYGLVAFITPVSMNLLFGLSYMDIPYKKWFKYIWKFILIMLVLLLIIFALLAYL